MIIIFFNNYLLYKININSIYVHRYLEHSQKSVVLESSAKLSLGCQFGSPALAWHKIQEPLTHGANVLRGSGIKNTLAYMFCNIMISTHHVPPSTLRVSFPTDSPNLLHMFIVV